MSRPAFGCFALARAVSMTWISTPVTTSGTTPATGAPFDASASIERGLARFPEERAVWVVLDECTRSARQLSHDRPQTGRGYVRRFSAELLVALSSAALEEGASVLAATPYRAQAQLIGALASEDEATQDLVASTIHRQQGSQHQLLQTYLFVWTVPNKPIPQAY